MDLKRKHSGDEDGNQDDNNQANRKPPRMLTEKYARRSALRGNLDDEQKQASYFYFTKHNCEALNTFRDLSIDLYQTWGRTTDDTLMNEHTFYTTPKYKDMADAIKCKVRKDVENKVSEMQTEWGVSHFPKDSANRNTRSGLVAEMVNDFEDFVYDHINRYKMYGGSLSVREMFMDRSISPVIKLREKHEGYFDNWYRAVSAEDGTPYIEPDDRSDVTCEPVTRPRHPVDGLDN